MGVHSTCLRLRYNFWWPTITRDVKHYVNTCDRCARRARITVYDRVLIKSIERSNVAFNPKKCLSCELFRIKMAIDLRLIV